MTVRRIIAIAVLCAAAWPVAGQHPAPQVTIVSPTAADVLSGVMTLAAEVKAAGEKVNAVTFFVDGTRACSVAAPPYRCSWDSASMRGARDVRAVAEFSDGTRAVEAVRTKGTVATFRAGVDSVMVAVRVQDEHRRFVRGLDARSFKILEDGVPQDIATFSTESAGGDVVLALDGSASMTDALPELRAAARAFLGALPRNDMVTVTVFNSALEVLAPRGTDPVPHVAALDRLHAAGTTALYDVMIQAVDLFSASSDRRAIVMFTDGDDSASRASLATARLALQNANVVFYIIAQGKGATDRALRDQLTALATETGGAAFFATRMSDTRGHFAEIADELSNQYVLGYQSTRPVTADGWRQIRVESADPATRYAITSRQGYLATRRAK